MTQPFIAKRRMTWIAVCLAAVWTAAWASTATNAQAQEIPTFDSVEIALWPEFDKPSMLVIYRANLSADVQLPVNVSLPIPAGIQPNAVAQGDTDGRLVDVAYALDQQDGRNMVNLQVSNRLVWLEYYQDLSINGSDRTFAFQWPGGLAVPSLSVQVQDPPSITNLNLQPASTDEVVGEYGLTYKRVALGAVGPSDQPTVDVSYTKIGDGLTVDTLPQTPAASPTEPAVGSAPEPSQVVTWVVVGLAAVLAIVIGVLYFRVWRVSPKSRTPRRRHRPRSGAKASAALDSDEGTAGEQQVFCHECGQLAGPQDRFCRSCGTRLRR